VENGDEMNLPCIKAAILCSLMTVTAVYARAIEFSFDASNAGKQISYNNNLNMQWGSEFLVNTNVVYSVAPEDQSYPAIAFDGINYFVVWTDERSGSYADIYGARVDQSGNVLDPAGIVISTAADIQSAPAIAFDGVSYFVVWTDKRSGPYADIYGARVDQSGHVLDSAGIAISSAAKWQSAPTIACDGTNSLVVWVDERSIYHVDIYGARVEKSGDVLDQVGIIISMAASSQSAPAIACDGTNYLVVWSEALSDTNAVIYGARVEQLGRVLDTAGIVISAAPLIQSTPAVAFGGTAYLVVWEDIRSGLYTDIYGARVDQSGTVLDTTGIVIAAAVRQQWSPAVTFDGTNYLVVWENTPNGSGWNIYGARVDQSGFVLDPAGIVISTAFSDPPLRRCPAVAFDGINYLVVWEDGYYDSGIHGARVDQSGTVLDTAGIVISDTTGREWYPAVAFDGTSYLVVWKHGLYVNDIYCARVDQNGTVLDPSGLAISTAPNDQRAPAVTFGDTTYLVVWEDERSGLYDSDIYGAELDTSGVVIDSFAISTQSGNQGSPALAHCMDDQFLITYSGWAGVVDSKPYNAMRIWGKFYSIIRFEDDFESQIHTTRFRFRVCPNPVHKECAIEYALPKETLVCISIYDVTGRSTKKLVDETQDAGLHNKVFDITDLAQGVYFMRLKTANNSSTKKIVLIK